MSYEERKALEEAHLAEYAEPIRVLTEDCERGLRVALVEPCVGSLSLKVPPADGFGVEFTVPFRFGVIVNGRILPEGAVRPLADTPEEALQQFREGWARLRSQAPATDLIWRLRPELKGFADPFREGSRQYYVRARFVLYNLPTLKREADAFYASQQPARRLEVDEGVAELTIFEDAVVRDGGTFVAAFESEAGGQP